MFSQNRIPQRDKNDFILEQEYRPVLYRRLENRRVEVTTSKGTSTMQLADLIGEGSFILAFQPGASTKYEADNKLYSQKPGAVGCGGELVELDKISQELAALANYKIIIISTKSSEQQRQVLNEKADDLPYKALYLISDPKAEFAKSLGLYISTAQVINQSTHETAEISYVERVRLIGSRNTIKEFFIPVAGETPTDNVKRMLKHLQDQTFNLTDNAAASIGFNPAAQRVDYGIPFFLGAQAHAQTQSSLSLTDVAAMDLEEDYKTRGQQNKL